MNVTACISPFENETDSVSIGEALTIENRLDRVQVYGQLDITRDQEGYEKALDLKRQLDAIVNAMKRESLPKKIELSNPPKSIDNPFKPDNEN